MSNPNIIEEKPLSMAVLKEELVRIKERDGELGFRGDKCEDYLNTFVKLSSDDVNKLKEEVVGLKIPRLGDDIVVKVADIMPKNSDELKVLLQAYHVTVTKENMQKIVDVVSKYA